MAKLAHYNFKIKHVPGRLNVVADALSRDAFVKPLSQRLLSESYTELLRGASDVDDRFVQDVFRLTSQPQSLVCLTESPSNSNISLSEDEVSTLLESHSDWESASRLRAMSVAEQLSEVVCVSQSALPAMSLQELRSHQQRDPSIAAVLHYVERRWRPSFREHCKESQSTLRLLRHWDKLSLRNSDLYRVCKDVLTNHKRIQYVLPESLRQEALAGVHDHAGHQGQARTLHLARQRFFWHDMEREVREYVKKCGRCVLSKTPEPAARAPLESIKTTAPLELVCIDFWSAEDHNNRSVDILVITDHFTKLAQAFPCRDQTAKKVARTLWDKFFCVYGFPKRIHSDQGTSFESELIAELLRLAGVTKSHTTPYHPMGNGGVERFNRTLGSMLRSLPPRQKHNWPQMLQTMTFVYNCTAHETTGFAPFYLMFGRVPRLPVDLMFGSVLLDDTVGGYDTFVDSLLKDLKTAMSIAQKHIESEQKRQSGQYNKKVKGQSLSVGDRVLVANKACRGKRKLADRWGDTVYTVVAAKPAIHVYRIRSNCGNEKVVHRNLLLEVNFLPFDESTTEDIEVVTDAAQDESCSVQAALGEAVSVSQLDDAASRLDAVVGDRTSSWVSQHSEVTAGPTVDWAENSSFAGPSVGAYTEHGLIDESGYSPQSTSAQPRDATPHISHTPHTPGISRFGRVIRPVCRLIESMVQLQSVLDGDAPERHVIHV